LIRQGPVCPPDISARLLEEANRGCAKCGIPLITIHRIEGYDQANPWPIEQLIMLCVKHHWMAYSNNGLPKEELYLLKAKPFNSEEVHDSFRLESGTDMVVRMGGMTMIECPIVLQITGEPMIVVRREADQILLSVKLYDQDDGLEFLMVDNIWEADIDLLDLRYEEHAKGVDVWISIRMRRSNRYAEVRLKNEELHILGSYYRQGHLFESEPDGEFRLDGTRVVERATVGPAAVGFDIL
jgi:hypothetical protein